MSNGYVYVDEDGQPIPEDEFSPDKIGAMPDAHLVCRDLGHSWPRKAALVKADSGVVYKRTLICRSCKTERIDVISLWGSIVSRQYHYPDRYQMKGVQAWHVSRDDFRREVLARAGIEDVEQRDWGAP